MSDPAAGGQPDRQGNAKPPARSLPHHALHERRWKAARTIQNAWRCVLNKRTFACYRMALFNRASGNPAKLLRTINPREAQLLDKAAGVFVKFRLGGECFPPNIYYRIYTHRPVEDLCANSPKVYTCNTLKLEVARQHNTKPRARGEHCSEPGKLLHCSEPGKLLQDSSGWYKRWENNGWREISDTSTILARTDPVEAMSGAKRIAFHHDKARRREELAQERKKKKIEWMVKLYHQGLVKVNDCPKISVRPGSGKESDATGANARLEKTSKQEITTNTLEPDEDSDGDEVEELLYWTANLDYDEYVEDWQAVGTSGSSSIHRSKHLDRLEEALTKKQS